MSCNHNLPPPPSSCGNDEYGKFKAIFLMKDSDLVFDDNGVLIRIKRKYGKFKREIIKLPITNGKIQ